MAIQTNAKINNSKFKDEKNPEKKTLEVKKSGNSSPVNPEKADEMVLEINPNIIIGIVLVVIVVIAGVLIFRNPDQASNQPATLADSLVETKSLVTGFSEGKDNAPITIVEYSDFECVFCKMHVTGLDPRTGIKAEKSTYQQIKEKYIDTGIVKYVSKPYTSIPSHNPAFNNEYIANLCAAEQDKYFEYYHRVYELTKGSGLGVDSQGAKEESLLKIATDLGLDKNKFTDCYKKRGTGELNSVADYVNKTIKTDYEKKKLTIGTPLFVICKSPEAGQGECSGISFAGAETFENFSAIVESVRGNGQVTATPTK